MVDIKNFKWEVVDDKNVKVNYYDELLEIKKDDEGDKFFILPNPYCEYEKKTKDSDPVFENWVKATFNGRDDLAYKSVKDGFADSLCAQKSPFPSFDGMGLRLLPMVYLDRNIVKKKKDNFMQSFEKLLKKFSWAIRFYTKGGNEHIFRDDVFKIVSFNTEKDAKKFVKNVKEKFNKDFTKAKKLDEEHKKAAFQKIVDDSRRDGTSSIIVTMLLGSGFDINIDYICFPEFYEEFEIA